MFRFLFVWPLRLLGPATLTLGGLAAGAAYVFATAPSGLILCGGLVPGAVVCIGLALAVVGLVNRHAPLSQARRRALGRPGIAGRGAAALAVLVRSVCLGVLLAALVLLSFNPVESRAYCLLAVDQLVNDEADAPELLRAAVDFHRRHCGVRVYDTPRIADLVKRATSSDLSSLEADWQEALADLHEPINDRLARLASELRDRAGDCVTVLATTRPAVGTHPWPIHPGRHSSVWVPVLDPDGSRTRRAARLEVVGYRLGCDAAVRNFLLVTVRAPRGAGTSAVKVRVTLAGDPVPTDLPLVGWGEDHAAFYGLLPRHKAIRSVRAELSQPQPGQPLPGDLAPLLNGQRGVRRPGQPTPDRREVKVRVSAALESLKSLPLFSGAQTPTRFVESQPDVAWVVGPARPETVAGATVEVVLANLPDGPRNFRQERQPAFTATPLGEVWNSEGRDGWPDLGRGQRLPPNARVLIRAVRDDGAGGAVLFHRDPDRPEWLTLVMPSAAEAPRLSADQMAAAAETLLWATSMAWRGAGSSPAPVREEFLVSRADDTLPLGSPQDEPIPALLEQTLAALAGRFDDRLPLVPANGVRGHFSQLVWLALGTTLGLALLAALVGCAWRVLEAAWEEDR